MLPKDGSTVKVDNQKLAWHALDSKLFHVKLFRFASGLKKQVYGVLFWAVTIIDCDEDIPNIRLSAGSNLHPCGGLTAKRLSSCRATAVW